MKHLIKFVIKPRNKRPDRL